MNCKQLADILKKFPEITEVKINIAGAVDNPALFVYYPEEKELIIKAKAND